MTGKHQVDISDLSILLVEPSKTQAKVIQKHLLDEGVSVVEVSSTGEEALESLLNYQPDLIISSMYLPDMTATNLVEQVKSSAKLKDIPFMLISSETRFSALDPIRQAGVVAILPKPFGKDDLNRALRNTVDFIDPEELTLEHYEIEAVRVLVVDDSSMARKHIVRVLNNMGITLITEAKDGKQGIEIFSQEETSFDLIVTDYNMPDINGLQLIAYVRAQSEQKTIPIIMVTSEQDSKRLAAIKQAGVSAVLDKPFEPASMRNFIIQLLN